MKPLAWSHSALDDFVNCPRAYFEKRVAKSVVEEPSEQILWGNEVHKAFELYVAEGKELPGTLTMHKEFIDGLEALPGESWAERKIAMSKELKPCGFFDKNVWFRGVIDYTKVHKDRALIVDYKTGKPHTKFKQLKLNALWIFAEYPEVSHVAVSYYWTKTKSTTDETYTRDQVPDLWRAFLPDLKQYREAFHTDVWQPRQSGLCNGWCPVRDCEFWKPRRT